MKSIMQTNKTDEQERNAKPRLSAAPDTLWTICVARVESPNASSIEELRLRACAPAAAADSGAGSEELHDTVAEAARGVEERPANYEHGHEHDRICRLGSEAEAMMPNLANGVRLHGCRHLDRNQDRVVTDEQ